MKKNILMFMAMIAILSSSPLVAMEDYLEETFTIQLPCSLNLKLLEQIEEDGFVATKWGRYKFPDNDKKRIESEIRELLKHNSDSLSYVNDLCIEFEKNGEKIVLKKGTTRVWRFLYENYHTPTPLTPWITLEKVEN